MITRRTEITEAHKENILKLFYRTELRKGETLIDNRTTTISKELGISTSIVDEILVKELDRKYEAINSKVV